MRLAALFLAGTALLPWSAAAQTAPAAATAKQVHTPADFARFAPKTAYDMLVQVPGFTIREADQERGLGQASENVLINGERIANKTGGAIAELQRIAFANVERIEIVDASSLGIAGLAGQVANIILKDARKAGGQFEWRPDFRAHYSRPNLFRGNISYTGKTGGIDYTLSLEDQAGRGAIGGPEHFYAADGSLIERREEVFHQESDTVTAKLRLAFDGPGTAKGNLTLGYSPYWNPVYDYEQRFRADGNDGTRLRLQKLDGWMYDINADYEFAFGPGRLKVIGLRHFDHEPIVSTQVDSFASGAPDQGTRFTRNSHVTETIARGEYRWKMGKNDLEVSLERAVNGLDQRGALATLDPQGDFVPVPFPGGSGIVREVRYEGMTTLSRPLGSGFNLQLAAGGETSTLERVDGDLAPRRFFRPKGSLTLGWQPDKNWDLSLKLRRRVGQISFYDFLAQPNLKSERQNSGNPDLVPPQSWEVELEVGRSLGAAGKTRLRSYYYAVEDIVDIVPIGADGEGVGNLPHATRFGMESTSTIQFAPLGLPGAKLDAKLGFEIARVRDPLTGEMRPISGTQDRWAELNFRHDIPKSDFAWGATASLYHYTRYVYLTEVNQENEGPWFVNAFVEHKDVFGLTLRAQVGNIFSARHYFDRTVHDGRRNASPLLFRQRNDQLIGPIFTFTVRGSF
ncbi:TonB-dependent receptor plug domain-containing protein [Sphingomonas sp. Sphisp140]|uniref:TonB-dependent receptor plug domain-containing protein n=1 Tax=unclassified Sphingomonas TaxID=196159 RepID=UPI0039B11821